MSEKSEALRLVAENERLAAEVANRNRRALAGNEAVAALANVHAHYEGLEAQRDALLVALKRMATIIDKMGDMPDGFIHPSPWQTLKCEEALTQARAAIKMVEEGK